MTIEEAIKIIYCYDMNFYDLSGEKISAGKLAEAFDMAIEALQAKTDGDLISRQSSLAEFKDGRDVYDIMESIEELPSAEPKTGWIPCSERLPEDTSKPVLISGRHKKLGMCAVDIARYNGGMWQYDGFTFPDCDILAWMPLPEPYKGGEGE